MNARTRWLAGVAGPLALACCAAGAAGRPATRPAVLETRPATTVAGPPSRPTTQPVDVYELSAEAFFKRPEVKARIKRDSVDIALLEVAIFHQTNVERAANDLPLVKHSWALHLMARRHSAEMGALQFFAHVSPTPANRTIDNRLTNVGMDRMAAGENIGVLPAREAGPGRYILRKNPDGSETIVEEATGRRVDYYSYEGLAKAVLIAWMNSPGHRANIMRKGYVYLGVGTARAPYDTNKQDSFYMTQDFSREIIAEAEMKGREALTARAATQRGR